MEKIILSILCFCLNASMLELVDRHVSEACALRRMSSTLIVRTNDVSVQTSYRTDDMKINQKWLIFFNAKKVIQSLKERMVLEMKLIEKNIDN